MLFITLISLISTQHNPRVNNGEGSANRPSRPMRRQIPVAKKDASVIKKDAPSSGKDAPLPKKDAPISEKDVSAGNSKDTKEPLAKKPSGKKDAPAEK